MCGSFTQSISSSIDCQWSFSNALLTIQWPPKQGQKYSPLLLIKLNYPPITSTIAHPDPLSTLHRTRCCIIAIKQAFRPKADCAYQSSVAPVLMMTGTYLNIHLVHGLAAYLPVCIPGQAQIQMDHNASLFGSLNLPPNYLMTSPGFCWKGFRSGEVILSVLSPCHCLYID